jgi:hypothetical protein
MGGNTMKWLKTSLMAILGGAVAGAAQSAQAGQIDEKQLTTAAITGAATVVVAYLMKSPTGDK